MDERVAPEIKGHITKAFPEFEFGDSNIILVEVDKLQGVINRIQSYGIEKFSLIRSEYFLRETELFSDKIFDSRYIFQIMSEQSIPLINSEKTELTVEHDGTVRIFMASLKPDNAENIILEFTPNKKVRYKGAIYAEEHEIHVLRYYGITVDEASYNTENARYDKCFLIQDAYDMLTDLGKGIFTWELTETN